MTKKDLVPGRRPVIEPVILPPPPPPPPPPPTHRGDLVWLVVVPWLPEPLRYVSTDPGERLHVEDVSDLHIVGARLVDDGGVVRAEALWSRRAL